MKGIWWLTQTPDKQLQGEVTYGPTSGADVDLFGHPYDRFDEKKLTDRFTLHGLTFKAKPISLFQCLISGSEINLPGGMSCKIKSVSGIVGGHFLSLEEVAFQRVQVRFTWLRDWVWITGIRLRLRFDKPPIGIIARYRVPQVIPLGRIKDLSARIEFTWNVQPDFHSLQIEEDCSLIIEADQMRPYAAFEECITAFQRFLCLAVQRPVYPLQITGRLDKPERTVNNVPKFQEFLIIQKLSIPDRSLEKLMPQEQLFTLHEIGTSPSEILARFIEREKKIEAAMDLYFSTIYNDSQLPRVEFLTLAQSLEAYHRATMPGKYMEDEPYHSGLRKKLWEAIPAPPVVDADFRASLDKKLDYLHEFSLKKRLKELAKKHALSLETLIGNAEDFSAMVSDLRNKLTHPSEENTDAEADYRKLLRLSEMMALLIEVCFLDELGFPQDRIKEIIFNRSQRAFRVHRGWL